MLAGQAWLMLGVSWQQTRELAFHHSQWFVQCERYEASDHRLVLQVATARRARLAMRLEAPRVPPNAARELAARQHRPLFRHLARFAVAACKSPHSHCVLPLHTEGAVYGPGIYLSPIGATSLGYSAANYYGGASRTAAQKKMDQLNKGKKGCVC